MLFRSCMRLRVFRTTGIFPAHSKSGSASRRKNTAAPSARFRGKPAYTTASIPWNGSIRGKKALRCWLKSVLAGRARKTAQKQSRKAGKTLKNKKIANSSNADNQFGKDNTRFMWYNKSKTRIVTAAEPETVLPGHCGGAKGFYKRGKARCLGAGPCAWRLAPGAYPL